MACKPKIVSLKNDNLLSKESNNATSYIQIFLSGSDNFCSTLSSKFFYPYLKVYISLSITIVVVTKQKFICLIVPNVGLYCFLNQNLVYNNYKPMSYTILNLSLQLKLHFVCSLQTLCQFADRLSHLGQNHVNEKEVMNIATFTFLGFREKLHQHQRNYSFAQMTQNIG